jgi:hypothetical protein
MYTLPAISIYKAVESCALQLQSWACCMKWIEIVQESKYYVQDKDGGRRCSSPIERVRVCWSGSGGDRFVGKMRCEYEDTCRGGEVWTHGCTSR